MQWDHLVAVIKKATPQVRRAQLNISDKWILEFVGRLDKVLPAPTLYQNIHYPFAPGNHTIRNAATGTVMEVNASTGKNFDIECNKVESSSNISVSDVKQDEVVKASSLYNLNFMLILIRADKGFWIGHLSNPFLVYDLRGGNPADGTEICLWPKNDLEHQKWYFDPV
ncbi:hypothetical protein BN14_06836 [Rhizoctonia solani AG-1 IB]|uniref:Ricin B lectin domain-containing protein n=1 Tax=Thanatephorus cucumeris (strain AG1-IB / isolate 7/3/14) TaxID=1108050 RepID=M5BYQ2_THACB|nr:hypothetical protein BN14_06836 [Rhizoctonia solani AG-1 IB]